MTPTVLILAAGLSRRMGTLKPLMPFGATTVLGHVLATCHAAGLQDIRVVTGHRGEAVAAEAERHGAVAIDNPAYESGMFSSVQAGVAALGDDVSGVLVLPADLPLIRPATIARVAATFVAGTMPIVRPVFARKRGHPPAIGRALFADILASDGAGGLAALLDTHEAETADVAVFDRGVLMDMDYPGDHAALLAMHARHAIPDDGECVAMLAAAGAPVGVWRHCTAVAALATALAERLAAAGLPLDVDLIRAAALTHDIAKGQPDHAEAGAALLRDFGFPDVAAIVAKHMDCPADGMPDAAQIVFLADKLVAGTVPATLEARFARAMARFQDDPAALAGAMRRRAAAEAILYEIGRIVPVLDLIAAGDRTRVAG
jgi:putative nucleotidyltransferase with HDIG domain